jgi:crotonobetainyl-CoA:carnitine CoA-transferase CaiB-like acyl-CoA transferase
MSARPFSGVRILDFTQVLAGPYASYQLALLGADVIKIERRGGEDMRRTPLSREWADRNMAPPFLAVNGNKKSLTLDLQKPAAREIVLKLAAKADVVMENFRAGVMDRLGLGYAALSVVNPRLIYCAISGFGQTGPASNEAGYDGKIQAMSGIMAITGHPEMGPTRAGFAVCDVLSGATGAFAISSALFQRTHTGTGQFLDVSMLEASLALLSTQVADYTVAGHHQQQAGNQAISRKVTANLFRAKDSFLLLAVNDEKQYRALMTALGRSDVFDDPRFSDWFLRKENETALRAIIEGALAAADSKTWERRLNDAGAPCASIWKVEDIIDHPQVAARGVMQTVDSRYGPIRLMGSGFQMAHGGGKLDTLAPEVGADTDAVLAEIGYDDAAIAALRADAII